MLITVGLGARLNLVHKASAPLASPWSQPEAFLYKSQVTCVRNQATSQVKALTVTENLQSHLFLQLTQEPLL